MSDYRITITRVDENPNYKPERNLYYREAGEASPTIEVRHLEATLTDSEFDVIKQALIQHWDNEKMKDKP